MNAKVSHLLSVYQYIKLNHSNCLMNYYESQGADLPAVAITHMCCTRMERVTSSNRLSECLIISSEEFVFFHDSVLW